MPVTSPDDEAEEVELDDLAFDQEVAVTMKATGASQGMAAFLVAMRRGDVSGCLEEVG